MTRYSTGAKNATVSFSDLFVLGYSNNFKRFIITE